MATTTKTTRTAATPPAADAAPAPEEETTVNPDVAAAAEPEPAPAPFIPDLVIPDDYDPDDPLTREPKPTHFLALACGHRVATLVPVASHHYCEEDDVTVPVVGRFPYPPSED